MSVGERIRLTHVLTHPKRFAIVDYVRKTGRKYIAEISAELSIDRKIVSFHLKVLEREGLINTRLERKIPPKGNPVFVRYVDITPEAIEVLESCSL